MLQLFNSGEAVVAKLVGAVSKSDQLEVKDRALRPLGAEDRQQDRHKLYCIRLALYDYVMHGVMPHV